MQVTQVRNPMKFRCAPNEATPDYVAYDDFERFVAYGLLECWFGHDDDPNEFCNFPRPWDQEDVRELRSNFLSLVETVVAALWKGQYSPGDGDIDGDWQSVTVAKDEDDSDLVMLTWYVSLRDDAIMFDLHCTGADPTTIWLNYEGIEDRQKVLAVLTEAEKTVGGQVWEELVKLTPEDTHEGE